MKLRLPFGSFKKHIFATIAAGGVIGGLVIIPASIAGAWVVKPTATATCTPGGFVQLSAQLHNGEVPGTTWGLAMTVTMTSPYGSASSSQVVQPGQTSLPFIVDTSQSSIPNTTVTFTEVWTNGTSGSDQAYATATSISCSAPVPPTPTPTTVPPVPPAPVVSTPPPAPTPVVTTTVPPAATPTTTLTIAVTK